MEVNNSTSRSKWYLIPLIGLMCNGMMGVHLLAPSYSFDYVAEGSPFNQLLLGSIFLLAGVILVVDRGSLIELLKANRLLLLFMIYTLLSCLWSAAPFHSLKRWGLFLGIILTIMAAQSKARGGEIRMILLWFTALSLLLSLILIHPLSLSNFPKNL